MSMSASSLAIGLMSGTSADGIDAALVELHGIGPGTTVTTRGFVTVDYSAGVRDRIFACFNGSVADVCALNVEMGEEFARAAAAVAEMARVRLRDVDFIASHGQTVWHNPPGGAAMPSTLQIGDGSVIAQRTGRPTVCDFRTADMAAGGQGAPLVPLLDDLLFRTPGRRRVALNIGGVANVTIVDGDREGVLAFDTGPGNALIDACAKRADPALRYDKGGALAASGRVDEDLLAELLAHPFFATPPPRSTGRELFGEPFAQRYFAKYANMAISDLAATFTAFTARSIAEALARFAGGPVDEVIASGGGIHNPTLMEMLRSALGGVPLTTSATYGLDPDAKEAIAFAVIAHQTMHGLPGNVPSATGAKRAVTLGKICLP